MTVITPAYRLTIYEEDGATPLAPRAGSVHSEAFKVCTKAGVAGFRPYMNFPRGRRSRIDLLDRRTDIGELTVDVIDARLVAGGSNFERWVTAFVGDEAGQQSLIGKPATVEETLDGATWSPYLSGTVQQAGLASGSRVKMQISVRENGERMKARCFVGRPHPDVTYADSSALLPLGPAIDYGGFPAVPRIPGTVASWSESGHGSGFLVRARKHAIATGQRMTRLTAFREPLVSLVQKDGVYATTKLNREPHADVHVDLFGADGGAYIGSYALMQIPTPLLWNRLYAYVKIVEGFDDVGNVSEVGIAALDADDPRYAPIPTAGTDVEFRLVLKSAPTDEAPIYVERTHPAQIAEDLLAGKFGRFHEDGTAFSVLPIEASSFSARQADTTIPKARFAISEGSSVNEFIEQELCLPFGLAYRFNGAGEVSLVDVRHPSTLAGVATITNDDLSQAAPGWAANIEGAIAEVVIAYYIDSQVEATNIFATGGAQLWLDQPTWLVSRGGPGEVFHHTIVVDSPGFGRAEPFVVDARGLRYSEDVDDIVGQVRHGLLVSWHVAQLVEHFRMLFSGGLAETTLACRRTTATDLCMPGDVRIIDVDEVPNAASNLRGGSRLARCVERTEEGPTLLLRFVDMGADAVAVSPTIGTPTLVSGREKEAISATVTLNAAGEPAVVWFAATPAGTGSIAEDDERWRFGGRRETTGAVQITGLPSGSRIFVRARTEAVGDALKLPSPWVTPSGTKYVNTTGLAAPTGLAILSQDGSSAQVTFTPGSVFYPTEMYVDGARVNTLPANSTLADFRPLATGAHTLGLKHIDGIGGASSLSTIGVTISGGLAQCPAMIGIGVAVGKVG